MTLYPKRTIIEWTDCFRAVYEKQDQCRRPEEFWNASMAHLSSVGEAIRKTNYPELLVKSAHAFCWMCSFTRRLNDGFDWMFSLDDSLSHIVGFKYPMVCGYCFESNCKCPIKEREDTNRKTYDYNRLLKKYKNIKSDLETYSLHEWQNHFSAIYSNNISLLTMEAIGFHLLEEAGETAKAIRLLIQFRGLKKEDISEKNNKFFENTRSIEGLVTCYDENLYRLKEKYGESSFEQEILKTSNICPIVLKQKYLKAKLDLVCETADTFSWFCNVLVKLGEITKNICKACNNGKYWDLENMLISVYGAKDINKPIICYACKKNKCDCTFFHEKLD